MATSASTVTSIASYYDDENVSKFYEVCWGGSDIHIGLYETGDETVAEASEAMTRHLVEQSGISAGCRVLDVACGFGGTLRWLAKIGCHPKGIDISKVCVDRARQMNIAAGLSRQIEVAVGDFHEIDSDCDYWDAVICQESLIHSPDRPKVFAEVYRILRHRGIFAFSDILTGESANCDMANAAFARLGARAGATVSDYRQMAEAVGFEIALVEERPDDIRAHYDKLAKALAEPRPGFSADIARSISKNISCWQAAIAGGEITWACFVARKP
jgi:sarcosine/dimethylglycine N-methyltransferase